MSSLPIERSDNTTENNIILQHYNQPHESDRTEDSDVNQHKPEKPKKLKINHLLPSIVIFTRKFLN